MCSVDKNRFRYVLQVKIVLKIDRKNLLNSMKITFHRTLHLNSIQLYFYCMFVFVRKYFWDILFTFFLKTFLLFNYFLCCCELEHKKMYTTLTSVH